MLQPDLFAAETPAVVRDINEAVTPPGGVVGLLERLSAACERPRYNYMLLTLIAEASDRTGAAGPFVQDGGAAVPIRDWLCDALSPLARQDPRRLSIAARVRVELAEAGTLPDSEAAAERTIAAEVQARLRRSGRTNVSRAVSELVRMGLLRRHYQGYRVDHHNRGAQRQAVYTITEATRRALAQTRGAGLGGRVARAAAT
ncbi:hypothetical protein D9601_16880 [Sphingomonas sp. MA1305]|jgi:hypothetical protein|uniref:hypothetical protein n=1 Tax=Sphingomonas sp. MA1305 TaxID=2479204 RepID=UPI0018DF0B7A|nr:hypothetical protein [Sphingomonas sp. MA1305]MBI0477028.1 hypothetical protein [Sphingomonas sp. MA1305]